MWRSLGNILGSDSEGYTSSEPRQTAAQPNRYQARNLYSFESDSWETSEDEETYHPDEEKPNDAPPPAMETASDADFERPDIIKQSIRRRERYKPYPDHRGKTASELLGITPTAPAGGSGIDVFAAAVASSGVTPDVRSSIIPPWGNFSSNETLMNILEFAREENARVQALRSSPQYRFMVMISGHVGEPLSALIINWHDLGEPFLYGGELTREEMNEIGNAIEVRGKTATSVAPVRSSSSSSSPPPPMSAESRTSSPYATPRKKAKGKADGASTKRYTTHEIGALLAEGAGISERLQSVLRDISRVTQGFSDWSQLRDQEWKDAIASMQSILKEIVELQNHVWENRFVLTVQDAQSAERYTGAIQQSYNLVKTTALSLSIVIDINLGDHRDAAWIVDFLSMTSIIMTNFVGIVGDALFIAQVRSNLPAASGVAATTATRPTSPVPVGVKTVVDTVNAARRTSTNLTELLKNTPPTIKDEAILLTAQRIRTFKTDEPHPPAYSPSGSEHTESESDGEDDLLGNRRRARRRRRPDAATGVVSPASAAAAAPFYSSKIILSGGMTPYSIGIADLSKRGLLASRIEAHLRRKQALEVFKTLRRPEMTGLIEAAPKVYAGTTMAIASLRVGYEQLASIDLEHVLDPGVDEANLSVFALYVSTLIRENACTNQNRPYLQKTMDWVKQRQRSLDQAFRNWTIDRGYVETVTTDAYGRLIAPRAAAVDSYGNVYPSWTRPR